MIAVIYITLVITHFLTAATLLFLSTLVYFHDTKHITNRALAALMLVNILWLIADFMTLSVLPQEALPWVRITMLISTVSIFSFMYLALVFPRSSFTLRGRQRLMILTALLFSAGVAFLAIQGVDVLRTSEQEGIPFLVMGRSWLVWKVIWAVTFAAAVALFFRKWRTLLKEEKKRWSVALVGIVTPYAFSLTLQYLSATTFFVYNVFSYVPLILGVGYSILRYRAFKIKVIVSELLVFVVWLFMTLRLFFATTFQGFMVDFGLLVLIVIFSVLLIKSVLNEVKEQEELKVLGSELMDLRDNLESKIIIQREEIKRAYEIEKAAREELEELNIAKNQFILITQHHLRTPLTIIKGYTNVILGGETGPMPPTLARSIKEISGSVDTLTHTINKLLYKSEG